MPQKPLEDDPWDKPSGKLTPNDLIARNHIESVLVSEAHMGGSLDSSNARYSHDNSDDTEILGLSDENIDAWLEREAVDE